MTSPQNPFIKNLYFFLLVAAAVWLIFTAGLILGYSSSFFYSGKYGNLRKQIRSISKLAQSVISGDYFNSLKSLVLRKQHDLLIQDYFPGKSGISISTDKVQPGYLLISRLSAERDQFVIDLINKKTGQVVYEWHPTYKDIYSDKRFPLDEEDAQSVFNMVFTHPLLLPDGSVIFIASGGRLVKIDKHSKIIWQNKHYFHHSINLDADGNLWIPSKIYPSEYKVFPIKSPADKTFWSMKADLDEEAIVQVNPEGNIIKEISVPKLLLDSGLKALLINSWSIRTSDDPTHINDIQPVLKDRYFAKKGDVLISLRSLNLILIYRPSEDKVIWYKTGPWIAQHDVDVLNDDEISVLNNDRPLEPYDKKIMSTVMIYNFKTGQTYEPYNKAIEASGYYVWAEGLHRILPNGNVFIEENVKGRILELSKDSVEWEYVNRYDSTHLGHISWSRFVPAEDIDLKIFEKGN